MKELAIRTLVVAVLLSSPLLAASSPAAAADSAGVQNKIDAAMKSAKSFVVMTQFPAQAYSSTLVYVAPDRYRVSVAIAASTTDVITIGETSYSSKNGAPFEKAPVTADQNARLKAVGQVKVGTIKPDLVVGGISYGAFDSTAAAGADATLSCTYDKKNFRLVRCGNDTLTETFDGYDDPKNVVDVPGGAN